MRVKVRVQSRIFFSKDFLTEAGPRSRQPSRVFTQTIPDITRIWVYWSNLELTAVQIDMPNNKLCGPSRGHMGRGRGVLLYARKMRMTLELKRLVNLFRIHSCLRRKSTFPHPSLLYWWHHVAAVVAGANPVLIKKRLERLDSLWKVSYPHFKIPPAVRTRKSPAAAAGAASTLSPVTYSCQAIIFILYHRGRNNQTYGTFPLTAPRYAGLPRRASPHRRRIDHVQDLPGVARQGVGDEGGLLERWG